MGRRKPNALKRLSGSRHYNEGAPRPPTVTDTSLPRGLLSKDAKKFWKQNIEVLADLGLVTVIDLPAFALMAEAWAFAWAASDTLHEEGLVADGAKKNVKKHPSFQEWRDASNMFLKLAGEFGMLPAQRSGLDLSSDGGETLDQFFARLDAAVKREGGE